MTVIIMPKGQWW